MEVKVTSAAVELSGITKRFSDVVAVNDLDLTIGDGEFFSLLGPSGCGKTTTLRMVAGLEFPTEGSIRVFGEEMGLRPPNKRPINTVFQSYALFPHMTVAQNIGFGLEMRGVERSDIDKQVDEAVQLVRLGGMERRKPTQLSGGQQQRVALARALVNRPKVLLLDEPLGALDLKLRQAMQTELKDLQERVGISFVYVTHDQEEALTMSDRIGVMNDGVLLQVGSPEQIYEHPETRFVADFIGETAFINGVVAESGVVRLPNGNTVRTRTDVPSGTAVTLALRPERLYLAPPDEPAPASVNQIDGTVRRRVYLGNANFYEVDVGFDTLKVRLENTISATMYAPGDTVVVQWQPGSSKALSE
jgi:spermidine/putrescine transport system ATP-binding protein